MAPSLLDQLHGTAQDVTVTMLDWMLEHAVRRGYIGARELLSLEGARRSLFPRRRTEALAQGAVTANGELAKVPGRRVCAPAQKDAPPAMGREGQLRASYDRSPEAYYEEWRRVRAVDRRRVGRLTRSGALWDGLPAGRERWVDKLAQLEHFVKPPLFTNAPPFFSVEPHDSGSAVRVGGDDVNLEVRLN